MQFYPEDEGKATGEKLRKKWQEVCDNKNGESKKRGTDHHRENGKRDKELVGAIRDIVDENGDWTYREIWECLLVGGAWTTISYQQVAKIAKAEGFKCYRSRRHLKLNEVDIDRRFELARSCCECLAEKMAPQNLFF